MSWTVGVWSLSGFADPAHSFTYRLSSPPSTAITLIPIAFAYWTPTRETILGQFRVRSQRLVSLTMSKTTTGTDYNDPLTRTYCRTLASRISRDTSTHNRSSFLVRDAFRDPRAVPSIGNNVLLKGSGRAKPGVLLTWAVQLIGAVCAKFAVPANGDDPLHSCTIS